MRTALPHTTPQLQSRVRAALGPSAFNSLRSLMLRQQSTYEQQLSELHVLSQVQRLLVCEMQISDHVGGEGVFPEPKTQQQQPHQALYCPSGQEMAYGCWADEEVEEEEEEEECVGRGSEPRKRERVQQRGAGAADEEMGEEEEEREGQSGERCKMGRVQQVGDGAADADSSRGDVVTWHMVGESYEVQEGTHPVQEEEAQPVEAAQRATSSADVNKEDNKRLETAAEVLLSLSSRTALGLV